MSETIVREWRMLWYAVATGACFALSYDVLRLLRRLFRHSRTLVDIEDILYWTACFFASFTLLYYGNHGVVRFFAVLGAAAGMWLYYLTLGRWLVRTLYFVIAKLFHPFLQFAQFFKSRLTRARNHLTIKIRRQLHGGKGEKAHARTSHTQTQAGVSPQEK